MAKKTDQISSYLQKIAKISLLKNSEEIELGQQIKRRRQCLEIREKLQAQRPNITQEEWARKVGVSTQELNQILKVGEKAKNKMIQANLRLVVAVAKKYQNRGLEFLDLVQEGNLGLMRAVEKFEVSKGCKFSTYAHYWIKLGITRGIGEKSRTIRLPIHVQETLNKLKKVQREYQQKWHRLPTASELSVELDLPLEKISWFQKMNRPIFSLEKPIKEDEDATLESFIRDPNADLIDFLENLGDRSLVNKLLESLTPKERLIIEKSYLKTPSLSDPKIGQELNVSRESIRKTRTKALKKLQSLMFCYLRVNPQKIKKKLEINS